MNTKRRWMNWVLEESAKETVSLPWARGKRPIRARATAAAPKAARA